MRVPYRDPRTVTVRDEYIYRAGPTSRPSSRRAALAHSRSRLTLLILALWLWLAVNQHFISRSVASHRLTTSPHPCLVSPDLCRVIAPETMDACVCVCVCVLEGVVYVWQRECERDTERHRETESNRDSGGRQREQERQTERQTEREGGLGKPNMTWSYTLVMQ